MLFAVALRYTLLSAVVTVSIFSGVTSRLTRSPANNAAIVGQNVTFQCRIHPAPAAGSVLWLFQGLDKRIPTLTIYNGTDVTPEFTDRYSVLNGETGQLDLFISNTSLCDAGTYTCLDNSTSDGDNASAIYTVLGHEPYCSTTADLNTTLSGDFINMTCYVLYNGSLWQRPLMAWFLDSQLIYNDSFVFNPNTEVWSNVTLTARWPHLPSYECRAFFGELVDSDDEPANLSHSIPSYNFSWFSPGQHVYLAPVNTTIHVQIINGTNSSINIHDSLHCSSTADPPALLTWLDAAATGNSSASAVTTVLVEEGVASDVFRAEHTGWRNISCVASSPLGGEHFTDSATVTVYVVDTGPSPVAGLSAAMIAVIVVVSCVLLFAFVLVIVLYCRRVRSQHPYRHMIDDAALGADDRSHSVIA